MKATGIIRRIDDLGRVVIPKEIRRTLRIHEGDPLEILLDGDGVIFKKYSFLDPMIDHAQAICDSLYRGFGFQIAVTDLAHVRAISGVSKHDLLNKPISSDIFDVIKNRVVYTYDNEDDKVFVVSDNKYQASMITPLFNDGEVLGSVIILGFDKDDEDIRYKVSQTAKKFIEDQFKI